MKRRLKVLIQVTSLLLCSSAYSFDKNSIEGSKQFFNKNKGFVVAYDEDSKDTTRIKYQVNDNGQIKFHKIWLGGILSKELTNTEGKILEQKCFENICKDGFFKDGKTVYQVRSVFPNGKIQVKNIANEKESIVDYKPTFSFQEKPENCPALGDFYVQKSEDLTKDELKELKNRKITMLSDKKLQSVACIGSDTVILEGYDQAALSFGAEVPFHMNVKLNDDHRWTNVNVLSGTNSASGVNKKTKSGSK